MSRNRSGLLCHTVLFSPSFSEGGWQRSCPGKQKSKRASFLPALRDAAAASSEFNARAALPSRVSARAAADAKDCGRLAENQHGVHGHGGEWSGVCVCPFV